MKKINIINHEGEDVVIIPTILFKNKQNIDWDMVEEYLKKYVGEKVINQELNEFVHIGKISIDEFCGSVYSRNLKGARAKAKANVSQGLSEIIKIAIKKKEAVNKKDKHARKASKGWYYFVTKFAIPIMGNDKEIDEFNIYSGCIVMNKDNKGKLHFYDLVEIKKEARNPLKNY